MLRSSHPSIKLLQLLGGLWVFAFQFRRPCLSCFSRFWRAIQWRCPASARLRLVAMEVMLSFTLLPLIYMDM